MEMLSNSDNAKLSRVLTHELVDQVTKSMNMVNFSQFESNMKQMLLSILEKPIHKMGLHEQLMQKFGQTLRKSVRRVHEMEHVIQKYSRVADAAETFDNRYQELESRLIEQKKDFDLVIADFHRKLSEDIPD